MFDLYTFSFNVINQVHQAELPGVLTLPPLKKAGRGRENDWLLFQLSIQGKNPYSPADQAALLQRAAQVYYKSNGSLTAGMKSAAETINAQLLEYNLKSARDAGGQAIGRLCLAILREDTLFLAVSGPAHALVLGAQEVLDCWDAQSGRGLGAGTSFGIRYFQARLQTGDVLVFSPEPPAAWTPEALAGSPSLTLEHLRRRLLNGSGPDLQASVLKFQNGNGQVHALRHRSAAPEPMTRPASAETDASVPTGDAQPPATRMDDGSTTAGPSIASSRPDLVRAVPPVGGARRVSPAPTGDTRPPATRMDNDSTTADPSVASSRADVAREARPSSSRIARPSAPIDEAAAREAAREKARLDRQARLERKQKMGASWQRWKEIKARFSAGWHSFFARLTPRRAGQPAGRTSPAILALIAIAVPLVVTAAALTLYMQSGRGQQRTAYYEQAAQLARLALSTSDAAAQRSAWSQVLEQLDLADQYGITPDSRDLRTRAQQGVDQGDKITRLTFKPATHVALPNDIKIRRMLTINTDLYILDDNSGAIRRLTMAPQGYYELDLPFSCGPGPSTNNVIVGKIVDFVSLSATTQYEAVIAAIDSNGNLLFCGPGKPTRAVILGVPNLGWGKINTMVQYQDGIYVFDSANNAIWYYKPSKLKTQERPDLLSGKFSLSLNDVIDMELYEENIYFLRSSGKITQCFIVWVEDLKSRCNDPAQFNDPRPGHEKNPTLFPGTTFTQLMAINAPDPSLYILDTAATAIHRFSLVLNFLDQYRPNGITDYPLPKTPPGAFTISNRRVAFLAYGSQIFMAQVP